MFKDKLRELREEKGLSQQELADQLKVTRLEVVKWEEGREIPNPDGLKAIADFFAIDKKDLLSGQDAIDALYTIQNSSKSNRKQNMVLLGILCLMLLGLALVTFLPRILNEEKLYDNQYFSETQLSDFSLSQLEEIEHEGKYLTTSKYSYYAQIDDDVDVDQYAIYVLNFLLENPHISFVGFDIDRTTQAYEQTDKRFIAPSEHINDYKSGEGYKFYYIDSIDSNRDIKSPVLFKSIHIGRYTTLIEDEQYNFTIGFRKTDKYSNIYDYYLFEEYYDANIINITTENFTDFFTIEIMFDDYLREYFMVTFIHNQFFVHANIEIDIVVKYETKIFEAHKVIQKGYDFSTVIIISTDTNGWDPSKIELISYEVSYGKLWVIE